ncbi:MAG: PAS domain-containing protein, partial [Gammaproteobacteria bacterium]
MSSKNKSSKPNLVFSDFLALLPGHAYWKDRQGKYLGCNQEALDTFHLKNQSEVIGRDDYAFMTKKLAANIIAIDQEIMASGVARIIEEQGIDSSGRKAIYITKKTPLFDTNGKVTGLLGVSIDITDRKTVEKKVIEEHVQKEMTLENIIAMMPGNIYWTDKKGVYLGCNDNQLHTLGLRSRSEFIGKTYIDRLQDGSAREVRLINQAIIKTGVSVTREEPGTDNCGNKAIYLTNKVPLRNEKGEVVGLVGISIDITERKQLEEKLAAALKDAEAGNAAKDAFLENMRYDVRTPLEGMIDYAERLNEDAGDEDKVHEYADNILFSTHTLLDFLTTIIDAVKITSGELPIVKKKFDLNAELSSIMQLNFPRAEEKKLKFLYKYDRRLSQYMIGDPTRLQRILLELLSNALKYTNKGHIKVDVELAKQKGKDVIVRLKVEDTGIGIPQEEQQEVFLRFKKLATALGGINKGAGLGLSIVKQFVDDLQGEVSLNSEPGKGSTFICVIPM